MNTTCLKLFLALLFLTGLSWPYLLHAQPKQTVRLGAIVSLTGDAAKNGEEWLKGARLAVEDAAAEGLTIDLRVEDDSTNPTKTVSAFRKLVAVDKVQGVLGGTWDFLAETAFPFAAQARVPFVTPTNPVEVLSSQALENPWIYTNGLSLHAAVEAVGHFLEQSDAKRVGLVAIEVPYGIKHLEMLKETLARQGAEIAFERRLSYQGFNDEIKLAALDTRKTTPDAVFVVSNYAGIDRYLREIEGLVPQPLTLMTHTLLEAAQLGGFSKRFSRSYGTYQTLDNPGFQSRFEKRWGYTPFGYAPNGYDAAMCLAKAIAAGVFPLTAGKEFVCQGVTGQHRFSSDSRELVRTRAQIMKLDGERLIKAD